MEVKEEINSIASDYKKRLGIEGFVGDTIAFSLAAQQYGNIPQTELDLSVEVWKDPRVLEKARAYAEAPRHLDNYIESVSSAVYACLGVEYNGNIAQLRDRVVKTLNEWEDD